MAKYKWNKNLIIPWNTQIGMTGNYKSNTKIQNHIFEDVLGISSIYATRSSSKIVLVSLITNMKYEMFLTEFNEVIQAKKIKNTSIKGSFVFIKRGDSYGIRWIKPENLI